VRGQSLRPALTSSFFVPRKRRAQHNANRSRLIGFIVVMLVGVGTAFAVIQATRRRVPAPPALGSLGPLAPEIEDIVRQVLKSVEERPQDGARWGRLGMVCEANGLPGAVDDAVRDMRRAIEINSTYAAAYWRLGLWLLDENQIESAEHAFNTATEIQPADRAGWIGLARVYLQRGENERAAGLLERLVAAGGGESYVLQLLGTAYRRLERSDAAASALGVGARGEAQWSDPWTDEMLAFRRGYAALLKDATAYIVTGQFDPAIRILEQLRRMKPDDLVLMAHLGQVYVAAGREDEGVPLLEQVIAREPDRFEAYVDLATGYMHQDRLAKARAAVERALSIEPSFGPAYETLGLISWRGGDARGAIAAFDKAVRSDPRNARALVWMGMAQTNLGRTADALVTFQRASRVDPTSVDAWIGIANAELTLRDLDAATAALQSAQRLQPDRPAVRDTVRRLETLRAK